MSVLVFVILSVSLLAHESGHYLAARAIGLSVTKFCLFLDPGFRLLDYTASSGTRFCIGWIPLGAYVKTKVPEDLSERPDWFILSKPIWKQASYFLAGIAINLFLAILCLYALQLFEHGDILHRILWLFWRLNRDLAVFNLIPVPPLDGGQLLFLCHKALTGKELGATNRTIASLIGLAIITIYLFYMYY